jgi:hypothetical protein
MWQRNGQIDYRDNWEESIREAKVCIGLQSHLRRRRRRRRRQWTLLYTIVNLPVP